MTIGFPVVEILGEVISLVDPFTWRILYHESAFEGMTIRRQIGGQWFPRGCEGEGNQELVILLVGEFPAIS